MGEIYKITNKINNKNYIGQTTKTTNVRFAEHLKDMWNHVSPLYHSMHKYGIQNFSVDCLEECEDENLNERESYYISLYDSYRKGYNQTLGGGGNRKKPFDKALIYQLWCEGWVIAHIAQRVCSKGEYVKDFLIYDMGVAESDIHQRWLISQGAKPVYQIDFGTRTIIESYESLSDAARKVGGTSSRIRDVCSGATLSAYGFYWRFAGDISQDDREREMYSGEMPPPPKGLGTYGAKKVAKIDPETRKILCIYDSIASTRVEIRHVLQGITQRSNGFYWGYVEKITKEDLQNKMYSGYIPPLSPKDWIGVYSSKKVVQLDSRTKEKVSCYASGAEAARQLGCVRSTINKMAREEGTFLGYLWLRCTADCNLCPYEKGYRYE